MKRTPRRQRARLKAWAFLALFGTDEDEDENDVEDADAGTSEVPETDRDGPPDDGNTPEE